MSIKEISPVEGSTAYAPFLVVLLISLIREAIEEGRYQSYKEEKIRGMSRA